MMAPSTVLCGCFMLGKLELVVSINVLLESSDP